MTLQAELAEKLPLGAEGGGTRVLVVCDTGSACYGRGANERTATVGGWGHVLGDKGSAYGIGRMALRRVLEAYDRDGVWPALGRRLLRSLVLNEPHDLIPWSHRASTVEIAKLAGEVFAAGQRGDRMAAAILKQAAQELAEEAVGCARKLTKPGRAVQFVLAGSVLLKQPKFAAEVARQVRKAWPGASITTLPHERRRGAERTAKRASEEAQPVVRSVAPLVRSAKPSPTESRNPRSMHLDRMAVGEAVKLMLSEDATIPRVLLTKHRQIERVVHALAQSFRHKGRLLYVGAGTSGRLGVLDASECPPTFGVSPELVQGIIAGGQPALWRSVEGAEDDVEAGARAVAFREVTRRDVVVGIAASGTTPFVWGALREAKQRGARTVLICFNPHVQIPPALRPETLIALDLGPEVLTGSTRLKAGTATKLLLNLFTTLAMVRMGKVMSNLMVDMNPANVKLRDRAVRIVQALTGAERAAAEEALKGSGWVVKHAARRLRRH